MGCFALYILLSFGLAATIAIPVTTNLQINRIVGSSPAEIGQFPYQVSVHNSKGHYQCGGSIISKNHILTAAGCAYLADEGFIRAGSILLHRGGTLSFTAKIKPHENYTGELPSKLFIDVKILRVEPEIVFDNNVKPIELYDGDLDEAAANGSQIVISGFGETAYDRLESAVLMAVEVPIVDRKICSEHYEKTGYGEIKEDRFCAGAMEGGHGMCYADFGGPVVMDGKLIGIMSYSFYCGQPNYPSVNTNVAYYRDWIRKNIEDN